MIMELFLILLLLFFTKTVGFRLRNILPCRVSCGHRHMSDTWDNGNGMLPTGGFGGESGGWVPKRFDKCFVLISGVIGNDPTENNLKNGHYVVNFPLAITGHFAAIHSGERSKPAETTWLQAEVWDDEARENAGDIRRGERVSGVAVLLSNTWKDKSTGETRKAMRLRILKFLPLGQFNMLVKRSGIEDIIPSVNGKDQFSDSNFSPFEPNFHDQTQPDEAGSSSYRAPGSLRTGGNSADDIFNQDESGKDIPF